MRSGITDKFLWDMYCFFRESAGVAASAMLTQRRIRGMIFESVNPVVEKYREERGADAVRKIIYYLKKKNLIQSHNLKEKKAFVFTGSGVSKALRSRFAREREGQRPDRKWVMVMFDIPQERRSARILMRSILCNLEYQMFQQSVWVTSRDVSMRTEQLLQLHALDQYAKLFLIEEL